jgi:NitT/TauT family transport system substrate-binding protein
MSKFKLTKAGRAVVGVVLAVAVAIGVVGSIKSGVIKFDKKKPTTSKPSTSISTDKPSDSAGDDTINLSLDEWAGWLSCVTANGGLTTQPGSVFDQLGIKVNINVINDATESSNALISGDLQAAGYTTNRVAFLSQKFTDAGKNVIMPIFTNYSYGGDGIIASTKFADVNSWVNAKIGVPEFSEAETLVAWFVNNSSLSDADKATIMNNLIMFGTADDTAKAYFAGQIDVAATWEPYLTQAKTYTNSTVVFDTKSSSSLVMDGIVFDADWAAAHEDTVKKFVQGILMSYDQPINYNAAREVFPMYSTSSDADIDATYANAKMASWKDNYNILNDTAPMIYNQMCDIWEGLGETVNRDLVNTLFDTTYIDALKSDFKSTSAANATTKVTVSDETRANITQQVTGNLDYDSMLSKTANVTFVPDSSVFTDQASAASVLNDFVDIAKTLDGTMIVINGNINADVQTDFGVQLSVNRSQTVANYLASQGIDQNRLIVTGSSNAKYQADKAAGTLSGDASVYQSTDISFMRIEN